MIFSQETDQIMTSQATFLPSFDSMADAFLSLGALGSPAELHGMVCGNLCGGGRYSDREWLSAVLEFLDIPNEPPGSVVDTIVQLYHTTLEQLKDDQMGIQLLLPDDDVDISERVTALGQWCQGFLIGFGSSGVNVDTELSDDTADALRDFASFVHINPDVDEDEGTENDSEGDYMELVEYVRLATLSIFLDTGAGADDTADSPTLH